MDLRLQFLMIIRRRALLLETVYCAIFTGLAIGAYLRDFNQSCKPDIKLWLSVMVARTLLRVLVRLFMACAAHNTAIIGNNFGTAKKIVEMLDVFGMVWFAVGNLLVFNGINCARVIPMTFYVSIAYIGTAYFTLVAPVIIRFSLAVIPSRDGMRELPGEVPPGEAMAAGRNGNANGLASAVTAPQAAYWKDWLERHGCMEHVFCKETIQGVDVDKLDGTEVGGDSVSVPVPNDGLYDPVGMDSCPICLGDFGSADLASTEGVATGPASTAPANPNPNPNANTTSDETRMEAGLGGGQREPAGTLIVRFPCVGRHLFHVEVRNEEYLDSIRSFLFVAIVIRN
jgi:hypothetical protein